MNTPDLEILKSTLRNHGVCVVIPTYNNAGTVGDVVSETLRYCNDVIVVNDGSTDSTSEILKDIGGIDVVEYKKNAGKGTALKRGFKRAKHRGFKTVITLDSDGQHKPSDIPLFAKAIVEHPGAIIIGERDLSRVDINSGSSFANKFSNFWFRVQTGIDLHDTQTGYRAYPLKSLHGLSLLTSRYEAELELIVFAAWRGVEIVPIPIDVYYPPREERVSHFRPAKDFTRISVLNTLLCAGAVAYGLPMGIWNGVSKKKLFGKEFKPFTHRKGEKREAAVTLGRLNRSIYGISYFMFWAMGIFTPFSYAYFSIGKNDEKKKLRYHKMLRWITNELSSKYPGAKTVYENPTGEDFSKPSIVICNHQSHLDIPTMMGLSSKFIFLTNDWVQNNVFYGKIVHNAEFLPVSTGVEEMLPKLRELRDRGYSIAIFPEGTRSADCSIQRFRKGAFHLAKELEMDIVPMVLHGAGHYLPKKDFMFRKGVITLRVLKRHPYAERPEDLTLREEASYYRKLVRSEYDKIAKAKEKGKYFKSLALYKYAYRGWDVVSKSKSVLRNLDTLSQIIDNEDPEVSRVRIINSGCGVFPLVYALVNEGVEVHAYEENALDYQIASETAALPPNLHYHHAVWDSDYDLPDTPVDKTYLLADSEEESERFARFSPITVVTP